MFIKYIKNILRILVLMILFLSIYIDLKLPYYIKEIKQETAELTKSLLMLVNQKRYQVYLNQSVIGDYETIKVDILPQLEEDREILIENNKNLLKENRLLKGHLSILTTKMIFDTKTNKFKLIKNGKVHFDIDIPDKTVQNFIKSEISRKVLKILAKEKNPTSIKPKWTFEEIIQEIPAENSPERLMVGALGSYAIHFNDFLIIHDTSKNMEYHDTINHICIQLKPKVMKKLYNSVFIGNKLYVE